jgi:hypothetical protein
VASNSRRRAPSKNGAIRSATAAEVGELIRTMTLGECLALAQEAIGAAVGDPGAPSDLRDGMRLFGVCILGCAKDNPKTEAYWDHVELENVKAAKEKQSRKSGAETMRRLRRILALRKQGKTFPAIDELIRPDYHTSPGYARQLVDSMRPGQRNRRRGAAIRRRAKADS